MCLEASATNKWFVGDVGGLEARGGRLDRSELLAPADGDGA